jgi:hypothetical protein
MLQKDPSKRYDSSRTLQEMRKIYSVVKPNPVKIKFNKK